MTCWHREGVRAVTAFTPVRRLAVGRRHATGETVRVGELAQNRQGVFFAYDADYVRTQPSLSPFMLPFDTSLHRAPATPHQGLHGVFADSLPDGWGTMLMDRVFRRSGVLPNQLTVMDRLSYVADRGLGALRYDPVSDFAPQYTADSQIDLAELGEHRCVVCSMARARKCCRLSPWRVALAGRGRRRSFTCRRTTGIPASARAPARAWNRGWSNSLPHRCP